MNAADGIHAGPSLMSPAFVAMRGVVKVTIVICATVLAMGGKIDSGAITAIYTAVIAAGPIEQAASGIPELKFQTKRIEAAARTDVAAVEATGRTDVAKHEAPSIAE